MNTTAAPALPSWMDLLKRSGGLYLHDIFVYPLLSTTLIGTAVFPLILLDVLSGLVTGLSPARLWGARLLFSGAGIALAGALSCIPLSAMMVVTTGEEREVRGALKAGLARARRLAWVLFLYIFVTTGSAGLFVVPGLLMAVCFVFGPFLCALDGVGGLDALSGSREFFRGQAAPVAARVIVGALPLMILPWIPTFGVILACVCVPFSVLWLSILFQEIKPALGTRAYAWSSGTGYFRFALLGHLLLAGLLASSVVGRGAAVSPPDSAVGACARRLRRSLSGVDGFLDERLSIETKEVLERAGQVAVTSLLVGEKRWKARGITKPAPETAGPPVLPAKAAPPVPSVKAEPPSWGAPASVGGTKKWLRDFTLSARRTTLRVLDWLREKVAGEGLREAAPKPGKSSSGT